MWIKWNPKKLKYFYFFNEKAQTNKSTMPFSSGITTAVGAASTIALRYLMTSGRYTVNKSPITIKRRGVQMSSMETQTSCSCVATLNKEMKIEKTRELLDDMTYIFISSFCAFVVALFIVLLR